MTPWNRFHVHEYRADELAELLGTVFAGVQVLGMFGAPELYETEIRRVDAARQRIRRKEEAAARQEAARAAAAARAQAARPLRPPVGPGRSVSRARSCRGRSEHGCGLWRDRRRVRGRPAERWSEVRHDATGRARRRSRRPEPRRRSTSRRSCGSRSTTCGTPRPISIARWTCWRCARYRPVLRRSPATLCDRSGASRRPSDPDGDVAQLEEHRVRIAGVRGSSPLISTTISAGRPRC